MREPESLDVLSKHCNEFTKRIKPILRILKEDYWKEAQEGILLKGLKELLDSNTKNMDSNMAKLVKSLKKDTDPHDGTESKSEAGVARVANITKPAKVPTWTNKMSLETYVKQLITWCEINQDVPENVRYHDLIEELKKNGDMKG